MECQEPEANAAFFVQKLYRNFVPSSYTAERSRLRGGITRSKFSVDCQPDLRFTKAHLVSWTGDILYDGKPHQSQRGSEPSIHYGVVLLGADRQSYLLHGTIVSGENIPVLLFEKKRENYSKPIRVDEVISVSLVYDNLQEWVESVAENEPRIRSCLEVVDRFERRFRRFSVLSYIASYAAHLAAIWFWLLPLLAWLYSEVVRVNVVTVGGLVLGWALFGQMFTGILRVLFGIIVWFIRCLHWMFKLLFEAGVLSVSRRWKGIEGILEPFFRFFAGIFVAGQFFCWLPVFGFLAFSILNQDAVRHYRSDFIMGHHPPDESFAKDAYVKTIKVLSNSHQQWITEVEAILGLDERILVSEDSRVHSLFPFFETLRKDIVSIHLLEARIRDLEEGGGDNPIEGLPPEIGKILEEIAGGFAEEEFPVAAIKKKLTLIEDVVTARFELIQNRLKNVNDSARSLIENLLTVIGWVLPKKLKRAASLLLNKDDVMTMVQLLFHHDAHTLLTLTQIVQEFVLVTIKRTGEAPSSVAIEEIARRELTHLENDGINRTDYALARMGGSVVAHSPPYVGIPHLFKIARYFRIWSRDLRFAGLLDAGVVITSRLRYVPGDCFAFKKGSNATSSIIIRTAGRVIPDGFSIDHVSSDKTMDPRTAPRVFEVWGYEDAEMIGSSLPEFLGRWEYDLSSIVQTFECAGTGKSYHAFVFKVISNHGNGNYTCLYRARIHGKLSALP